MKFADVYARGGWAVVPLHSAVAGVCSCSKGSACPSAGKHPRLKDWGTHATSDAEVVEEWQDDFPNANVGVATGEPSGFVVLDVDPDNGGFDSLAQLGALPFTPVQRTGSGGFHYLFELPEGLDVRNSAGKLGPGLDVRGTGGQIVVAPSASAKGEYRWLVGPWEAPLAPMPEELVERLKRRAPAPVPVGERTTFPPASPELLDKARELLELHGPAVEGQGGDQHTFVAACLLVHDFALTDEEAWPLLVEWNELCQPPWSESELRAKLRGGSKYASRPYGVRRSLDAVEAARAAITEWQQLGGPEHLMWAVIGKCRTFAEICGDTAKRAVIERDLVAATGLPARTLALPKPAQHEDTPAGAIDVTPALHEVADKAIAAIAPHVYARNGVLCEVVKQERTFISDLEPARIVDLMSRAAKWTRRDAQGAVVVQAPPSPVAQILYARRQHPRAVRVLEAVTTAPVFLRDGSILQQRGYSPQARMFLEPSVAVTVEDLPTLADARAAVDVFRDLLCDFRFAEGGFESWLAGLLTSLVKSAIGNAPAPLVCVSASTPGAGKSMLTGIAARIIAGAPPEVRPYNPRDAGEWGKRVTAFVRSGQPISVFDNVNGAFGDETLDRLITSTTWSDRVLGASEAPPIPVVTSWWATGNNIEPHGDTVRRVLMVRIEIDDERPQERTDFKRSDLQRYALENRSDLLSAALTILRAYHVAGRPAQRLPAWGSFEAWSDLVRGALVWAGCIDPFVTQRRAADDLNEPEHEAHDFWIGVIEGTDGTPAGIANAANAAEASGVLGTREAITPFTVRRFLRRFIDKPRAGKRIRRESGRFTVERVRAAAHA